ncbi:hypothetical protein YPPY66_2446, partial [Yersinia pestis PY-66]
MLSNSAEYSV